MNLLFVILPIVFLFTFLLVLIISIGIKHRKEALLISKSNINDIKLRPLPFTFLTIFFSIMLAIIVSSTFSISKVNSSIYDTLKKSTYYHLTINSPDNYTEFDTGTSWNTFPDGTSIPANPGDSGNIYIDNAVNYFGSDSIYYVDQYLKWFQENTDYNIYYTLDVSMNLNFFVNDILETSDSIGITGNIVTENTVLNLNREEDFNQYNTFYSNNSYHTVTSIYYDEHPLNDQKINNPSNISGSQLENNQILMINGYPNDNFSLGSAITPTYLVPIPNSTGGSLNLYDDSSGTNQQSVQPLQPTENDYENNKSSSLNFTDYTYSGLFLTSSSEPYFNREGTTLASASVGSSLSAIGFVNETTFDSIFVDIFTSIQNNFDNQNGITTTDYEVMQYMLENKIINFSYNIVFADIFEKQTTYENYNNFNDEIGQRTDYILSQFSDSFKWEYEWEWTGIPQNDWVRSSDAYLLESKFSILPWDDFRYGPNTPATSSFELSNNYGASATYISIAILLVGFVIIVLYIIKIVKDQSIQMGTLKSLGFSQGAISISNMIYPIISLAIGFGFGILLSIPINFWWLSFFTPTYFLNYNSFQLQFLTIFFAALLLVAIFAMITFATTYLYLRKPSLKLIKEEAKNKTSTFTKVVESTALVSKNFNFKFSLQNGFKSTKNFLFIFLTVGGMSFFIFFSMASQNILDTTLTQAFDPVNFYYLGLYNPTSIGNNAPERKIITNEEFLNNKIDFNIVTSDPDSQTFENWINETLGDMQTNINEYYAIPIEQVFTLNQTLLDESAILNPDDPTSQQSMSDLQNSININGTITNPDQNLFFNIYQWTELIISDSLKNNTEYVSFYHVTYASNNQTIAIESFANVYIDFNNSGNVDKSEFVGNSLSLIGEPFNVAQSIKILDSSNDVAISKYLSTPDKNLDVDPNSTGNEIVTKAVVDSITAATLNLEVGDVIYVEFNQQYFNTAPGPIPVVVEEIGLSGVPFGIIVSKDSQNIFNNQTSTANNTSFYTFASNITTIDPSGDRGITTTTSNSLNSRFDITDGSRSLVDYFNGDLQGINNLVVNNYIDVPINLAELAYAELIVPVTNIIFISSITIIFLALSLITISMWDTITSFREQSAVLKSNGYSTMKISFLTTFGSFVQFLISFAISIPIFLVFINWLNTTFAFSVIGSIFFSITSLQILFMFLIILSIYVAIYLVSVIYYSNTNANELLKAYN